MGTGDAGDTVNPVEGTQASEHEIMALSDTHLSRGPHVASVRTAGARSPEAGGCLSQVLPVPRSRGPSTWPGPSRFPTLFLPTFLAHAPNPPTL